jgi:membrane-associated phospholipid phosphatase
VDVAVTAAAAAALVGSELAKDWLAPSSCRVCDPGRLDAWTRERLVLGHDQLARRASDVLAYGVLPAAVATHALLAARGARDEGLVDVLIVAEATALAMDLAQVAKFAVGRQRPYAHYGNWPDPARAGESDDNLSFFSGHTTAAFALASAAGTVANLRGYRSAPWVWGVGMTLAASVGYLRMAGDKHYLTDVLTGAAVGTAAGIALPRLLHGREDASGRTTSSAVVTPFGLLVVF